jgi:uncharacterized protein YeaO (DUF488 family)
VEIRTRRWNDYALEGDGFRLLICRYRPRGLKKEHETWDEWWPELAPSKELHAAVYGKMGRAISWEQYKPRYLEEMEQQKDRIEALAKRAAKQPITLLCSSACLDENRCHRSLLRELIEKAG